MIERRQLTSTHPDVNGVRKITRYHFRFVPEWNDVSVFRKWTVKFVDHNHWRVQHLFDKEDAEQECAAIFAKCHNKYTVYTPKHFMALYTRAVNNKFHKLARADEKQRLIFDHYANIEEPQEPDLTSDAALPRIMISPEAAEAPNSLILAAFGELPAEIRLALACLVDVPIECVEYLFRYPAIPNGLPKPDPTLWAKKINKQIHRLFGISYQIDGQPFDIVGRLRDLVSR